MSLILKPLLYLCSTIFRMLPQGSKMASAAPAIISIYQRQKEGQECMCLLSPIYPNSDQLSALLLFYLLSVSAGWPVWATSVAFLPLALWWVQPIQSMEGDENVSSGFLSLWLPFYKVTSGWLPLFTWRPLFSRQSALPDPLLTSAEIEITAWLTLILYSYSILHDFYT